jgi:hypothetical protein
MWVLSVNPGADVAAWQIRMNWSACGFANIFENSFRLLDASGGASDPPTTTLLAASPAPSALHHNPGNTNHNHNHSDICIH